jgi:hypothetical protein
VLSPKVVIPQSVGQFSYTGFQLVSECGACSIRAYVAQHPPRDCYANPSRSVRCPAPAQLLGAIRTRAESLCYPSAPPPIFPADEVGVRTFRLGRRSSHGSVLRRAAAGAMGGRRSSLTIRNDVRTAWKDVERRALYVFLRPLTSFCVLWTPFFERPSGVPIRNSRPGREFGRGALFRGGIPKRKGRVHRPSLIRIPLHGFSEPRAQQNRVIPSETTLLHPCGCCIGLVDDGHRVFD